jgi:hypothetical protein
LLIVIVMVDGVVGRGETAGLVGAAYLALKALE